MSFQWVADVLKSKKITDQAETLVMVSLAQYAHEDGTCWPAIGTIARDARMSERNTRYVLKRLKEKGLVTWEKRGPNRSNLYALQQLLHPATIAPLPCNSYCTPTLQQLLHPYPATAIAAEPSVEPSLNHQKKERAKPAGFPPQFEFVNQWANLYKQVFGLPYEGDWGKDRANAKRLMDSTGKSIVELLQVAVSAWERKGKQFWHCEQARLGVSRFCASYGAIVGELKQAGAVSDADKFAGEPTVRDGF